MAAFSCIFIIIFTLLGFWQIERGLLKTELINEFNLDFTESSTSFTSPPFVVQFTNNTPNLSNYNFTWDFGDSTVQQNNSASLSYE